jgi:hypothetical protein
MRDLHESGKVRVTVHHCIPRGHEDQEPNQNRQSYYDASARKLAASLNTEVEIVGDNIVSAVVVVFGPAADPERRIVGELVQGVQADTRQDIDTGGPVIAPSVR